MKSDVSKPTKTKMRVKVIKDGTTIDFEYDVESKDVFKGLRKVCKEFGLLPVGAPEKVEVEV